MYRRKIHTKSATMRVLRVGGGILLLLVGVVLLVTPGPGVVFLAAGVMLIASVHPPLHHWLSVRWRWGKTKWRRWRNKRKKK